jgi:hypothetical protein
MGAFINYVSADFDAIYHAENLKMTVMKKSIFPKKPLSFPSHPTLNLNLKRKIILKNKNNNFLQQKRFK